GWARWWCWCGCCRSRGVSASGVQRPEGAESTPDDNLAAGPDRRGIGTATGRVDDAGGCPTVGAGVISPAGVKIAGIISSAPDNHFATDPDCWVTVSGSGRIGVVRGCPTVAAGIISPAGVQMDATAGVSGDRFVGGQPCRRT